MTTAKDKYQEFFFYVLLFHNCFQFCSQTLMPFTPKFQSIPVMSIACKHTGRHRICCWLVCPAPGAHGAELWGAGPTLSTSWRAANSNPTPAMMFCRHEPVSYSVSLPLAGSAWNWFAFQEQGILTGQERGHPFCWDTQRQRFRSQLHNISGIFYLNKSN